MNVQFYPGFSLYRLADDPVFVAPHSGPAFEIPTSRDDNSDTVASICWMKTGGALILSGIPRKAVAGIDFNRDIPPEKLSLSMWSDFLGDVHSDELASYRRRYAWVAKNSADHEARLRIYNNFWGLVRKGNIVVFVHRKFTRMKNFPSMMDVITYQGRGVDNAIISDIVEKVNEKYADFFFKVEHKYKQAILLEQQRVVDRIEGLFSGFSLKTMRLDYRKHVLEDMAVVRRFADRRFYKRLKHNFNKNNFMLACRSALKKPNVPGITVESIFKGSKARRSKAPLFKRDHKIVMEVECNQFLGYWYPDVAAEIIVDILSRLREVDAYSRLGMKQTHIGAFLHHGE